MKFKRYSHRFGVEIMQHPKHEAALHEIEGVLEEMPTPWWKGYKGKGKYDIVQTFANTWLDICFGEDPLAWSRQQPAGLRTTRQKDSTADFRKEFAEGNENALKVQMEIEFGNVASSHRDFTRFMISQEQDLTNIGILVCFTLKTGKQADSGLTNFERACEDLESLREVIYLPMVIYGLSHEEGDLVYDIEGHLEEFPSFDRDSLLGIGGKQRRIEMCCDAFDHPSVARKTS